MKRMNRIALAAVVGMAGMIGELTWGAGEVTMSVVGEGWARSSVNAVIFRLNSLVTYKDTQYTAYYDDEGAVVVAKRKIGTDKWETKELSFTGNAKDAHNTITLGIDGAGCLHMCWDHHNNPLNYARAEEAGSLDLKKQGTDGVRENSVTYPCFFSMPDGDLMIMYRVGASGSGDLVLKRYKTAEKKWTTVQQNLIAGEGRQNAYPEFCVGPDGTLHLGWTWRRTPDVATNHDVCYARSKDGGVSWTDSTGKALAMPVKASTCEVAVKVPEKSDLMNQTTVAGDMQGRPYIATYWRAEGEKVPQYRIVYHTGKEWKVAQVGDRTIPFSLAGGGTKRIPMSRPLVLADAKAGGGAGDLPKLYLVFRDEERGEKVSVAASTDLAAGKWSFMDLTQNSVGAWEPTADISRWVSDGVMSLFVQRVEQIDGGDGTVGTAAASKVMVMEWKP